jgi:hypothetical protein
LCPSVWLILRSENSNAAFCKSQKIKPPVPLTGGFVDQNSEIDRYPYFRI